jgi:disulfide bond formation protein DsbB
MNSATTTEPSRLALGFAWFSVTVSAVAVAGSLWLSVGMNLKACPLCLYQRSFIIGAFAVVIMGRLASVRQSGLLALPLAVGAVTIAAWHCWLESTGKLECPKGILGYGSAPQQAAAAQVLVLVALLLEALASKRWIASVAAIVLGVGLGWGCIKSAPPMPPAPKQPYPSTPDVCRPPFTAPIS